MGVLTTQAVVRVLTLVVTSTMRAACQGDTAARTLVVLSRRPRKKTIVGVLVRLGNSEFMQNRDPIPSLEMQRSMVNSASEKRSSLGMEMSYDFLFTANPQRR